MASNANEDTINLALRKFLKEVGVTSQREIERLLRSGAVDGSTLKLRMTLTADGTDLQHVVQGEIPLG
ncbi:MAG: DUF6494 family protein [Hyphomicrobiaceae bacterium]